MNTSLTRRRFLVTTAAGAAGLALAGCAEGADPGSVSPGPNTAPGRFPVRIEGQLGAITIEREPKRVVALGQDRDVDAAVALGVVPLATPDLSGFVPGGVTPWVEAKLTGARPELLDIRTACRWNGSRRFGPISSSAPTGPR